MPRLLDGVRVVESSVLLNGASACMHLADLGAEVIKVESPFLGDYIRLPYTAHFHAQVNRNKRSLAVDFRHDRGREVFARLIRIADVFVTNAPGNRNAKLGLGYDQLRALNPAIVYCQTTGFGATGPYCDLPVHGQMMDCLAGGLPVEMGPDGFTRPHVPSTGRTGTMMMGGEGTATSAIYAAFHIAAGLVARDRTGDGCYIDVSAAEAVIADAWTTVVRGLNSEEGDAEPSLSRRDVARYQSYQSSDGLFLLFCPEETKFWESFCDAVGRPDLKPRSSGVDLRRELQGIFSGKTRDAWVSLAIEHGWPLGPVNNSLAEVRSDPQLRARGVFRAGPGAHGSTFTYVEQPARVAGQPPGAIRPAPDLGADTTEILSELGYDQEEILQLAVARVTTAEQRGEAIPASLADG